MITLGSAILFGVLSVGFACWWFFLKLFGERRLALWTGIISWIFAWVSIYILSRLI